MNIGIIGGGMGGLISALLLERQGFSVTLFEKEERLGGRLAYVERDGFKIDQGPTIVLLPHLLEEILTEAGISRNDYQIIQCDPLYSITFSDGTRYTKYPDLTRQLEEIRSTFPGEEKGFQRFLEDGKNRFTLGKKAFLDHAFVPKKTFWTYENMKTLLKLKPYQSVKKLMNSYFQDERLQIAYSLQTLYIGGDPFHAPALYSLVPFSEHEHGVYYLKGGYAGLLSILEQELKNRSISIWKNTRVTRIIREENRVTGLVADGTYISFDGIVYNGDYPLLSNLMDMPEKRAFSPSSSCVLIYFGLNRVYEDADVHQFFISRDFKKHMKAVFEDKTVPEAPSFYTFHPSKIDASLAPPGKGVLYTLIPVPSGQHID
ncbi:MAG: phytoene desaturase [Bacillaceae bacterium]|nr:phytoene desaturase [Bacillaceae bacterium]